ncbi:MAG: helicase-associated domain-containing protein [Spirochaetes bacterium]|nr:helicase-associated domain-containing protein [Spirochaetota bacterium]
MSSKTGLDKDFLINLLLITDFFLHTGIKIGSTKKNINQTLRSISKTLRTNPEDIEYCFLYLKHNNIIYEEKNYFLVNLNLLKKLIKEGKADNSSFIVLQSNYELLVKPEVSMKDLFMIIQFSRIKSRDVVYRFHITENSLHNFFLNNPGIKNLKAFLLRGSGLKQMPHNIEYMIDDVNTRMGEIRIGYASGYITAKSHILKNVISDQFIEKDVIKMISPTAGILKNSINLWDMFFNLKKKNFFPIMDFDKAQKMDGYLQVLLNEKEITHLLSAFHTLKEIGFEHHIKVDFNILNGIINKIEKRSNDTVLKKAAQRSVRYRQELKNSIKSYVLKSLKASIGVPQNLVLNTIPVHYPGENPATVRKEIVRMTEYCLKHKLKLIIVFQAFSGVTEMIIEPKYLYEKKILYYYDRETKEEQNIQISKITFSALI